MGKKITEWEISQVYDDKDKFRFNGEDYDIEKSQLRHFIEKMDNPIV